MKEAETWRLLTAIARPRRVRSIGLGDSARVGILLFGLVDILVFLVAAVVTFHAHVDPAVVRERSPATNDEHWVRVQLPGDGHLSRFSVDDARHQMMPEGKTVFVRTCRLFSRRVFFGKPALAPEATAAVWGFWLPPFLVTALLVAASSVCLVRPAVYRWLAIHGEAAPGQLIGTSLRELEQGLENARAAALLAEEPDDEPCAWVRTPILFEFRDSQGSRYQGRFLGFNGQNGWNFGSSDVTVVFDPKQPTRNAVFEALAADLDGLPES